MNTTQTGWIACDYTISDRACEATHGAVCATYEEAQGEARFLGLDGVRWLSADGYLYVDEQPA